jgi:DNA-binding PadR family transcriptional regulator
MSTPRLSASSYLVLGSISLLGKPTTYDISRHVSYSVGEFWPFAQSQLYAETARLAEAGLLASEREEGGRHRRHYSITDAGRKALASWLAEPTTEPPELRHTGLLKLFFSELATTEEVVELARAGGVAPGAARRLSGRGRQVRRPAGSGAPGRDRALRRRLRAGVRRVLGRHRREPARGHGGRLTGACEPRPEDQSGSVRIRRATSSGSSTCT